MHNFYTIISLDDAFDCYEMSKRDISKVPLYYYDFDKKDFLKIKGDKNKNGIIFINSYELCSRLIDDYLNQSEMSQYKTDFLKISKNAKNKIISFLWFFESIDGCKDFNNFEIINVSKALKKWCKINNLKYSEPSVYVVRNSN